MSEEFKREVFDDHVESGLGLYDDLDKESYELAVKNAEKILEQRNAFDINKNLEKDIITVPYQKYCVVSWVGPTFKAKTDIYGFRILGAFATYKNAVDYIHKIHQLDPTFDTGVVEMNLWTFSYPDGRNMTELERDEQLNSFIINHKRELEINRQLFLIRKSKLQESKKSKEIELDHQKPVPMGKTTVELEKEHKEWAETIMPSEKKVKTANSDVTLETPCVRKAEQKYAVMSFVGNTGANKQVIMSIKGVFPDLESAENFIKKYIEFDNTYDIMPCELYKWLPCDPDIRKLRHVYKEDKLNELLENDELQKEEALRFHVVEENQGEDLGEPLVKTEKGVFMENQEENIESMENFVESGGYSAFNDIQKEEVVPSDLLDNMEDLISTFSFKPK